MRIDDFLVTTSQIELEEERRREQEENTKSSPPASWKADKVSISDQAREMQQAAAAADVEKNEADDKAAAQEAWGKLHEAVDRAQGNASGSSSEDQIEALERKIEELQSRMAQIAGSNSMPEDTKESMVSSLNAQISQLVSQLAELKTEALKAA